MSTLVESNMPGEVLRLSIDVEVSELPLVKHGSRISPLRCSLSCQWWYFCCLDAIWVQRSLQYDVTGVVVYSPSRDVVRGLIRGTVICNHYMHG